MKCSRCGSQKIHDRKYFVAESLLIGKINHPILYDRCRTCGHETIPAAELTKVSESVKRLEAAAISMLPVEGFISVNEVVKILGVTKQAFSKNPRVKNNFIISHLIENRKFYYKPSVLQFKATNDGRINISRKYFWEIIVQSSGALYPSSLRSASNEAPFEKVMDNQELYTYSELANEFFPEEPEYGHQ